jgi:hypothetical protein
MTYRIKVQGKLDEGWSDWFDGMKITLERGNDGSSITTLTGPVVDQVALRGILAKIWDLNLTLISVTRIELAAKDEAQAKCRERPDRT